MKGPIREERKRTVGVEIEERKVERTTKRGNACDDGV